MVNRILHAIDATNDRIGKTVGWVIIPLTLLIVMEVLLRYVFNKPTVWAWDVNIQLQGIFIVLGGGYALLQSSHVSVDIIVTRISARKRAIIDVITGPVFIAAVSLLLWKAVELASGSIRVRECLPSTWGPPIYPFKIVMAVGIALMLLQGIVKWIRDLTMALHGEGARR